MPAPVPCRPTPAAPPGRILALACVFAATFVCAAPAPGSEGVATASWASRATGQLHALHIRHPAGSPRGVVVMLERLAVSPHRAGHAPIDTPLEKS